MATVERQIEAAGDDGFQYNTNLICRLYDSILTINSAGDISGYMFRDITVPQGATINSAEFHIISHNDTYDSVVCKAYCEDVDSPADMQDSVVSDIYDRDRTTAYADISISDMSSQSVTWGTYHKLFGDLVDPVQEVIDRAGWVSGNDILVIIFDYVSGEIRPQAYDLNPDNGAVLVIDYTPSASGRKNRLLEVGTRLGAEKGAA